MNLNYNPWKIKFSSSSSSSLSLSLLYIYIFLFCFCLFFACMQGWQGEGNYHSSPALFSCLFVPFCWHFCWCLSFFLSAFFKWRLGRAPQFHTSGHVSASGDECGRAFPDELRVNSFPWWVPIAPGLWLRPKFPEAFLNSLHAVWHLTVCSSIWTFRVCPENLSGRSESSGCALWTCLGVLNPLVVACEPV